MKESTSCQTKECRLNEVEWTAIEVLLNCLIDSGCYVVHITEGVVHSNTFILN